MISNYPYFGLPNYMRYMNPGSYAQSTINTNSSINQNRFNNQTFQRNIRQNNLNPSNFNSMRFRDYTLQNSCQPNDGFKNISSNDFLAQNMNSYKKQNTDLKTSSYNNYAHRNNTLDDSDSRSSATQDSSPIFNLFGLNIYFDDILIVCILFFLYNENVNDPSLFLILVLLLMS